MRFLSVSTLALIILSSCSSEGPVRRSYTPSETPRGGSGSSNSSNRSSQGSGNAAMAGMTKAELIKKAQNQYAAGNSADALTTLNTIKPVTLKPALKTEYWNLRGLVELANHQADGAEQSFQNAIRQNTQPEFAGYYQYNLASAYADEKKTDEAIHTLNLIDTTHMEDTEKKKVELLKEKLSHGETGALTTNFTSPTPSAGSAQTSPTPVAPVYQGEVAPTKIGLMLPLSGRYEAFGKKVQRAVELAFQASPVVKNREIQLIPVDTADGASSHKDALKKLVEEQHVIAVIGPLLSKGVEALPASADYYQVPIVSIAQVQGAPTEHIYSCSISSADQASRIVDYAMNTRGFKKFAILAPSNKPGEEMANTFWDQVNAHGGEVRGFELYDPDLNDFRAPVDKTLGLFYTATREKELKDLADKREELKIKKKTMKTIQYFSLPPIIDFDAVFIADDARVVGQIMPTFAYRDAKNLPYLGISSWNSSQLVSRAGDQAEGATFPVAFNTLNPPSETKRFYDLYNATYNNSPGELDAVAYDAAMTVLEVLKDKPLTREEFNEKLKTVSNVEASTGTIGMKDHHCSRPLTLYTVKKGDFQVVK